MSSHARFMCVPILLNPCLLQDYLRSFIWFAGAGNVSQYLTRPHPCTFDFWTSEDHWVNSYPSYTLVLKLILLSFFHHRLCSNSTFRRPRIDMTRCATLSSNLTSELTQSNISRSRKCAFAPVSSGCKLRFFVCSLTNQSFWTCVHRFNSILFQHPAVATWNILPCRSKSICQVPAITPTP